MEIKRIIYNDKYSALYVLSNDSNGYYWDYVIGTYDSNWEGDYPRIRTDNRMLLFAMPFNEEQFDEHST